ncbi:MAG: sulfite exporter TauE/SafE family protein [Gammaproteobacteria bacterium]|nr:sulfite exporter TauE/SafE family protein [Gammaproteobacteria bacterium]
MIAELILVLCGIAISSVSMAVGIGGGILWTPLLILAYGLSPQEAITTSLLIQVIGMGSGSIAYFRAGLVKVRLSLLFFIVALPGVVIGSFISVNLSAQTVQMALGIMAMMLAALFVNSQEEVVHNVSDNYPGKKVAQILPIPAFFGFILGSLSSGIGEWLIPALRTRLNMGMRTAIATVIPMMFLLALVASLIHSTTADTIHWTYFIWGATGTIIGAQIGARLSRHINERLLKQSFIYLMMLIGIHLIFQSI